MGFLFISLRIFYYSNKLKDFIERTLLMRYSEPTKSFGVGSLIAHQ